MCLRIQFCIHFRIRTLYLKKILIVVWFCSYIIRNDFSSFRLKTYGLSDHKIRKFILSTDVCTPLVHTILDSYVVHILCSQTVHSFRTYELAIHTYIHTHPSGVFVRRCAPNRAKKPTNKTNWASEAGFTTQPEHRDCGCLMVRSSSHTAQYRRAAYTFHIISATDQRAVSVVRGLRRCWALG